MNEQIASLRATIRYKYFAAVGDGAVCVACTWSAFNVESILWIIALVGSALFFLYHAWRCLNDAERGHREIKTVKAREAHRRMLGR